MRLRRWGFNLFPAYASTGARIIFIAEDWKEVRVKLPLFWRTRNYVGTLFGGSMYAAVDPIYMMMLIKVLGRDFIVWDKSATINFEKPGRSTLFARFVLDDAVVTSITDELSYAASVERLFHVDLVDAGGAIHAAVDKTIYIRRKERAPVLRRSECLTRPESGAKINP